MKILFIGGTGTISTAISLELAKRGDELYLLNRGSRNSLFAEYDNAHYITCDVNDEEAAKVALGDLTFDSVCDFIGFVPSQLERDYRLFAGRTKQFMYISSASAYHKDPSDYVINEGTTMANPYWQYSRDKIACEEFLFKMLRENNFPITIVRPSHTYCERSIPLGVHGSKGSWQVVKRIMEGKQVIIHGDGTSLWTITDSRDFAKGFIGLIGNPRAIGEAFQITCDVSISWNQIYKIIADTLNVELKPYYVASSFLASVGDFDFEGSLIGDKANSVVFDNSKLKNVVPGLTMNIRPEEGIRRTIEYCLSHPECQEEDPEFDAWCDRVIAALENAKKAI